MYRKIFKILSYAALPAIFLISCKKSFLEIAPQGQLTQEEVTKDPAAAQKLVDGTYNALYQGGFGNTTVGFLYVMATDVASDDGDKGSTPSDFNVGGAGDLDNFTENSNNFILNNLWSGYYIGISAANQAVGAINNATFDSSIKNRLLGEAKFLRGLYYFNLVRLFGGVPKVLRVPNATEVNSDEFQTRASKDDIYTVIISDLQFSVDNLPLKSATDVGRATRGAAEALLAKVYLYDDGTGKPDYQKAYDLTKDIINSGQYALVSDYASNFREAGNNNSESVFEVQAGANADNNAASPLYSNGQGPRASKGWSNVVDGVQYAGDLGFGLNDPSADLANAYEPNDVRKNATIISVNPTIDGKDQGTYLWDGFRIPSQDSVENQRYNYKAYYSPFKETPAFTGIGDKDNKPKHIKILRYAEVLLINAEAAVQVGQAGDAENDLLLVRTRAGLEPVAATTDNVWKERRVELAMEQDRFFDIIRQGRAAALLLSKGFTAGKNEVYPIPQAQIDLSGGRLTQNSGY